MKNYKVLILFSLLITSLVCKAQKVDELSAKEIAMGFLEEKVNNISSMHRLPSKKEYELAYTATKDGKVCYYVFNRTGGGFVIVSSDERSEAQVLGYSTSGKFDYNGLGVNAKSWMESYSNYICALDTLSDKCIRESKRITGKEIDPLLGNNTWHQESPYNSLCPEVDGTHAPTGCVATSMGQVMWYHKWPERGIGNISYECGWNESTLTMDLANSIYQWDIIKDSYQPNDNDASSKAVATLLRDTGYSVETNYRPWGSGADAYMIDRALKTHFNYSCLLLNDYVVCNNYAWDAILQREVEEGRPVIYAGSSNTDKHSFVCDGSDGDGYFHFNFGWGGEANGYYLTSDNIYNQDQIIVIGIAPRQQNPDIYYFLSLERGELKLNPYTRSIDLRVQAYSSMDIPDPQFEFAMAKENVATGIIVYEDLYTFTHMLSTYYPNGKGLDDGTYRFYPVGRYKSNEDWKKVVYPESSEYVELEVKDEEIVWPHEETQWTIDGITYKQISDNYVEIINIMPDSEGTVRIPEFIEIEGQKLEVTFMGFEDLVDLKTLYLPRFYANIMGCPNLSKVIFTSPKAANAHFYNCPELKSIILPENLMYLYLDGVDNVVEIDVPNAFPCLTIRTDGLNETTSYVLHSTTPPSLTGSKPSIDKNLITFKIPYGYKKVYEENGFAGYNLIDDVVPNESNSIEWGYNIGRELSPLLLGFGYSSPGELSIMLDEEVLRPYIGKKIASVNYYVSVDAPPSYIFVADSTSGSLKQEKIQYAVGDCWETFSFPEAYTITGEPIYVGVGFEEDAYATFTSYDEVGDKYFYRGEYSNYEWQPVGLVCTPYKWPIALSVMIEGEDMPVDMHIHKIECDGKKSVMASDEVDDTHVSVKRSALIEGDVCEFQMMLQNRSLELVDNITVSIQMNDDSDMEIEVPCHMGPNMAATVNFTIPFENMPFKNIVNIDVVKVNHSIDNVANPVEVVIENVTPYLKYPKTNVVEGYIWKNDVLDDSNKVIEGINRINKEYAESAIGIQNVRDFAGQPSDYSLFVVPDGFGDSGHIWAHYEILRKTAFAAQDTPNFYEIFKSEQLSCGAIKNVSSSYYGDKCDIYSDVQIAYDAIGSDFRIAYVLMENDVILENWTGETPNSILRGYYPDEFGINLLPAQVLGDKSYRVHQSFVIPSYVQNIDNLDVVALLLNKRGDIINAHKSRLTISVPVSGIEINDPETSYLVGNEFTITASVYPENASAYGIVWTSSDETIATVDENGEVTVVGVGKVTITASCGEISSSCSIKCYPQTGDANWNGNISIADAVDISNYVVKKKTAPEGWNKAEWTEFYTAGANANESEDGEITFADAFAAVRLALAQPSAMPTQNRIGADDKDGNDISDALVVERVTMTEDGKTAIAVKLDNSRDYVALQSDIFFQEGMDIEVKIGNRAASHSLETMKHDENHIRLALFDLGNKTFADGDEPIFEIIADADLKDIENMILFNILAADANANEFALDYRMTDVTGVENVANEDICIKKSIDGIKICNAADKMINICTMEGQTIKSFVANGNHETINLPVGIYIVKAGNKTLKVIL